MCKSEGNEITLAWDESESERSKSKRAAVRVLKCICVIVFAFRKGQMFLLCRFFSRSVISRHAEIKKRTNLHFATDKEKDKRYERWLTQKKRERVVTDENVSIFVNSEKKEKSS